MGQFFGLSLEAVKYVKEAQWGTILCTKAFTKLTRQSCKETGR